MSKIICDVCGTSYPETATQCPICGCARHSEVNAVTNENTETDLQLQGNYTFVKGGRFSKSNVKKRNRAIQCEPVTPVEPSSEEPQKGGKMDAVLIATVVILLLAIIAVISYIALRVFFPSVLPGGIQEPDLNIKNPIANTTSVETTAETILPKPCVGITLSKTEIEFDKVGSVVLLNATLDPVDTTDEIVWSSTDTSVVTVTSDGKVEAVGSGQAAITASCGQAVAECRIVCSFPPAETTAPTTEEQVYPTDDFKLNRKDFTLSKKGDTHILYAGKIPVESIVWTTDNADVATIENGKVTAVGTGNTKVYAEYRDIKLSCVVRCAPSVGPAPSESDQNNDQSTDTPYNISSTDVTIAVGEEFKLQLLDSDKKSVSVSWNVADEAICSVSGTTVKGLKTGTTTVSVQYEGATYSCKVRVK